MNFKFWNKGKWEKGEPYLVGGRGTQIKGVR